MSLSGFLFFSALTVPVAVLMHACIRRFESAMLLSAVIASGLKLVYAVASSDLKIRPVDAVFWLPGELCFGMAFALPAAVLSGLPFWFIRRRRQAGENQHS